MGNLVAMKAADIYVNDEYAALMPRISKEDRHALKMSILADGQHTPIVVNPEGEILDGHSRWEVCLELNRDPKFIVRKFPNREAEREFILLSNLARRHLSRFQKIELAWEVYENEKRRSKERIAWRKYGDIPPEKEGTAMEIFGKYMGTGHTTIHCVQYLKENASPEILKKLRTGELGINRAYDLVKGIELMPKRSSRKPTNPPSICPQCSCDVVSKEKRKCHVHRWFCCSNCKWGI